MKVAQSDSDPAALGKLRRMIEDIHVAMLTTVTPDGALRSRPMATQKVQAQSGELWFLTTEASGKTHDISAEQGVNLTYADPRSNRFVSVTGMADLLHDPAKVSELWRPELEAWLPKGPDDPRLAVVRVRIESAEYWDAPSGGMVSLYSHPGKGPARAEGGNPTKVEIRAAPTSG